MKNLTFLLLLFVSFIVKSQTTENVFLITTDGLRWQEVFKGIDSVILNNKKYTENAKSVIEKFGGTTEQESRTKLMPFLWETVAKEGQIYGNRTFKNYVNIKNSYGISYPGYNEILTGFPDEAVNSNDKNYNQTVTFLEFLNKTPKFKGNVAAFCTWDVFPYIINEPRSGVPVNAGVEMISSPSESENLLNEIQKLYPSLASNRHDFITFFAAKEYIKKNKPNVMYIAFDETDEFAHEGKYREYLYAANTFDAFVKNLWEYCQNDPKYAGKTTFILTTDHGRGDENKDQWTSHGQKVKDCNEIWIAAIGSGIDALGEVKTEGQLYQNQIAQTVSNLLGVHYNNGHSIGDAIKSISK